ncbi:MAG: hypothetical protein AABZ06_15400 [Bdellovibrionota bacterium]
MTERKATSTDDNSVIGEEAFSPLLGTAKEVMTKYTHCSFCGANLHFTHVTNFAHNLTQETASCPECGIRVRRVIHRLQ